MGRILVGMFDLAETSLATHQFGLLALLKVPYAATSEQL